MAEVVELQKLKLAELRQECDARGLETKGNKGELIARLQAYLEEHGEEEDVDVDDVLAEDAVDFTKVESSDTVKVDNDSETAVSEPPAEKKLVKVTPPLSAGERPNATAELLVDVCRTLMVVELLKAFVSK
ncbi:SAP domain-containing ribonucleoprotein-like [Nematolebias whitei]|uniref:SAP domain-containing ribonucleoprotein-like n=1 Tax=Nematolebias whitei TaxID=451745 RepID=UPI00189AC0F9|nr:SAP domain-containing ribonucleoprotein-like [Nematolebias whitei]